MEFLIRGIVDFGEPGVFIAFEETAEELAANVASIGFDLRRLEAQKKLAIDYVRVERAEIEETGEYDLEGLFVRIQHAVEQVGAKRVVLDTIESLFAGLPNPGVLRSEIRRLFRWLKDRRLTVVVTGEKGEGTLTRQGLEEYVSDCVIYLDHRLAGENSTRRIRVVKYRGTTHGTNEYPFLIDEAGISILPVTSLGLQHKASSERVSTGLPRLDEMLGGRGYYRGSTVVVSGTAGTGKTSIAALLARAACERGERCLYFAYEESADQLLRNMRSVGVDLAPYLRQGLLRVVSTRPTVHGLEMHLVAMHKLVGDLAPDVLIVDPITNLITVGTPTETRSMLTRLIDFLKGRQITSFFTSLTRGSESLEETEVGISSLIDTWLLLSVVQSAGERNRTLTIVKSRGMAHSNQAAEFRLTGRGLELLDTYLGATGVVTGSARVAQEADDSAAAMALEDEMTRRKDEHQRRHQEIEGRIEQLRDELASHDRETERVLRDGERQRDRLTAGRARMAKSRKAFVADPPARRAKGRGTP
jgi:circadian clock protein KaiC